MKKGLKIFNIISAVIIILLGTFYAIASPTLFTTSNAPLMIIGIPSIIFAACLLRSQLKSDEGEIQIVEGEKIFIEPGKWSPVLSFLIFAVHIFMLPNIIIATDAPMYINIPCYCTTALSFILIITSLIKQKLCGKAENLKKRTIVIVVLTLLIISLSAGKYVLFAKTQQNAENAVSAAEYTKNISPTDISHELPAYETIRNEITSSLGTDVYYAVEKGTEKKTDSSGKSYTELSYYAWTKENIEISKYMYKLYDDGTAKFSLATYVPGATAMDFMNSKYFTWEYSKNSAQE